MEGVCFFADDSDASQRVEERLKALEIAYQRFLIPAEKTAPTITCGTGTYEGEEDIESNFLDHIQPQEL